MSYRQFIQSLEPLVYVDFTDDPLVNLGTMGGSMTNAYSYVYTDTVHDYPETPLDGGDAISANYFRSAETELPSEYRNKDFTMGVWVQSYSTSDSVMTLYAGSTNSSNQRIAYQMDGANVRRGFFSGSGSGSWLDVATPVDPRSTLMHHVVRRTMSGSSGTIEFFINGELFYTYGPYPAAGTLGKTLSPDVIQFRRSPSMPMAEGVFFDRALSDEEIRSMSVDYVPTPNITVLESGAEVPVEIEGEYVILPGNTPHALVTGANVYYNGSTTTAVQTLSNTRTSVSPMTYMAWAKVPAPNNALNVLFSHQSGTTYSSSANFFGIDYRNGVTNWHMGTTQHSDLIPALSDGNYHHFAYVMNGGTYSAYVDGVLVRTGTLTSTSVDIVRFGNLFAGANSYPWGEEMADMAVTTTPLTAQQVADVHAAGRSAGGPMLNPLTIEGIYNGTTQTVEPL